MWVFRKSVFENEKMRPTNDGMPLSEEIKILARRHLGKKKAIEISVPYRPRVGEAEIHTWGDGWKNLKFLFARRFGLHRTRTPWGGLTATRTPTTATCLNKRSEISLQIKVELRLEFGLHLVGSIHGVAFEGWGRLLVGFGRL